MGLEKLQGEVEGRGQMSSYYIEHFGKRKKFCLNISLLQLLPRFAIKAIFPLTTRVQRNRSEMRKPKRKTKMK